MKKLILFDLDGTLIDSEMLWARAISEWLADHGQKAEPDAIANIVFGHSWLDIHAALHSSFPALPPAKYARRFAAESEFLLRLALSGAHIVSVPVQAIYSGQRSKIRPLRDALRFWRLLGHFRKMERSFQKERGIP